MRTFKSGQNPKKIYDFKGIIPHHSTSTRQLGLLILDIELLWNMQQQKSLKIDLIKKKLDLFYIELILS